MAYGIVEVDELFENLELDMEKIAESLKNKLLTIRAGRANPHILDGITADYYGAPTPLNQMANISVSEARVLTISVWDISALKAVEKAIFASNIGITPANDGKVIRLVFPELTEERRKNLVKEIKTYSDNAIVGLRNRRRDANDALKKMKKDNVITEDDLKDMTKDVDNMLSAYIKKVEGLFEEKEKEILSV
ncbi:MAG: ribosome recycling factor [Christensenellales bacterium]|jgi:ribosome recycling factor